ncbi:MAG: bifunctional (p)ppGpp synthetase/guanosine-3',5'-bis(diphosphate) 3'-pyrophosphohydrolase [candidate division Zixibacteria bacterium]|nr:bifunctional (p)ppGpp synthetase/guanosine-3',5'-bis(diphosphate) 3'-pyrophosphohydrolase [candidate division Zixibacteria bacterium]
MNLAEFIINVEAFNANIDIPLIRKAYEYATKAHEGQYRASGEEFINHTLKVAFILAEQHMDSTTIAAGIMHDVVEDTPVTLDEIKKIFGDEITYLLDGLTKISGIKYSSYLEKQATYYRKMILAMAEDVRVVIIKLADRLHNMRTLESLTEEKRLQIAQETRDLYAPLAHRLGMARMKLELEDLALKYLNSDVYESIKKEIRLTQREREEYIRQVVNPLYKELYEANLKAEITGRAKHYDSIFRKMKKRNKPLNELYDLLAIRVITNSVKDCYHALGIVHTMWKPVAERFHDYIATPKSNMYQSLHTTIIGPEGRMVEIQIRTHSMHHTAEYGIASHWLYKEGKDAPDEHDKRMTWLREILDWQKEMTNPAEFMEYLKIDLFLDDTFVYTPRGEIKQLPKGSNPIDFAFSVHTDIGLHCIGAKINGRIRPLNTELKNGDEVAIVTSPHAHPTQDWINLVRTTKAKSRIRKWLQQQGFEESVQLGKDIIERGFKKFSRKPPNENDLIEVAMAFNCMDVPCLYAALGNGKISIQNIIGKIIPEEELKPKKESIITDFIDRARGVSKGIKVQGMDSMVFRFAKCCQPIPGDPIIGYITRGRGVSVHRKDCHNAAGLMLDEDRRIDVAWDVGNDAAFMIKLNMFLEDRKNIIKDITEVVASADINVRGAEIIDRGHPSKGSIVIEVANVNQMNKVMKKIKKVKGVLEIERASSLHFDKFDANE